MATWHCPHCGALQAEAARCWVCHRSSTTCSTCRNFRRTLATDVGVCSLDRRRRPLTGFELRGCWSGFPDEAEAARGAAWPLPAPGPSLLRGFVPLDEIALATAIEAPAPPVALVETREPPTSLFGDAER